jgi:hypothetical protein
MSRKYLIISIVTLLIVIVGWIGLYYLLGVKEEIWVTPPPIPNPETQKVETSTGGSEVVVSGEIELNNETPVRDICDTTEDTEKLSIQIKDLNSKIVTGKYSSWEINIDFWRYWYTSNSWSDKIGFWPYMMDWWPCQFWLGHLYSFYKTTPRNKDAILEFIKKYPYSNGEGYKLKKVIKINNREVVVWEDIWWYPTYTQEFEVIGNNENYRFYTDLFGQNRKETDYDYIISVIKSLKIDDTIVSFSPSQISKILTKIDENSKKQEEIRKTATGVLVQGDFRAEYVQGNNPPWDDIIKLNKKDIKSEIPGIINTKASQTYLNCAKTWTSKDECPTISFEGFLSFSPSGNYLLYQQSWWEQFHSILVDTSNWNEVLSMPWYLTLAEWTSNKKQFIYWGENWGMTSWWLFMTIKNEFPKNIMVSKDSILWWYIDNSMVYVKVWDSWWKWNFLKIYDLNTLKEVYSQEIK